MLTFFHQLVLIHQSVSLPQWVYRVDFCPDPKNISQWIEASKRLNCYHNLTSKNPMEQERIYHCLPSSFLNETLEFCSRSVLIDSGNCPVYSYEFGTSVEPFPYNCTGFISGCPTAMFKSKEVYKFPDCLKLRPKSRCFEAEKNCTNPSNTTYSNGKSNGGKPVTFLIYICLILLIAVVVMIIQYKCSNQRCQASETCHNPINTLQYQSIDCSTDTEREKDPLLSSNELPLEAKHSDSTLLRLGLNSQQKYSKISFYGGNAKNNLEYIETTPATLVNSVLEHDPLLSSNELTQDAKLIDSSLLQPCLYSKRKNMTIDLYGEKTSNNFESIEITTTDHVKSCQIKEPRCYPCLYLCPDTLILGYVYVTKTAVTLNEMLKTPLLGSCYLSSMWNRFVETEGSTKDKKRGQKRITLYAGIHAFDTDIKANMILIIVMENNDCKAKNRSIQSKYRSRNQCRITK